MNVWRFQACVGQTLCAPTTMEATAALARVDIKAQIQATL